jgi:hypothetical protein
MEMQQLPEHGCTPRKRHARPAASLLVTATRVTGYTARGRVQMRLSNGAQAEKEFPS